MDNYYKKYNINNFENIKSFINVINDRSGYYDIDESDDVLKMCLYMFHDNSKFYKYSEKKLKRILTKYKDNIYLFATACGKINILEYLESKNFDINYKNKHGYNAYIYAIYFGKIDMIKYLEKRNIEINFDKYIVVFSIIGNNLEVIEHFKNKYFNIYVKYDFIDDPYIIAVYFDCINIVKWLENIGWNKYIYKYLLCNGKYLHINACRIAEKNSEYFDNDYYKHYVKQQYNGYEQICKICYIHTGDFMIICKNNHPFHYLCQKKEKDKYRCLLCTSYVLI